MTKNIKLLDCTLRDGGYYNAWNFSRPLVEKYLRALDKSRVDVLELGLRTFAKEGFYGPYVFTSDLFLKSLILPTYSKIAVMVNASDLIKHENGIADAIDTLFDARTNSPVEIVRVASHIHEVIHIPEITGLLKAKGYTVIVNLMQVSRASNDELTEVALKMARCKAIEVLYFADSLGNMGKEDVVRCIHTLRKEWSGELGIHTHNNMERALENSLAAAAEGVTWLDATLQGMGRGAGNAKTEVLIGELESRFNNAYNSESLISICMTDIEDLKNEYRWGPNPLYYFSAKENIHPTYVQTMHSDLEYDPNVVMSVLKRLKGKNSHTFSLQNLSSAMMGTESASASEGWSPSNLLTTTDFLIIGAGQSVKEYSDDIKNFISNNEMSVLSVNTSTPLPNDLIDAFVACSPPRILIESAHYPQIKQPIILPLHQTYNLHGGILEGMKVFDFGVKVDPHQFEVRSFDCTIPSTLGAAYAICIAIAAGAKRIFLVGFDGGDDLSHQARSEMNHMIETYNASTHVTPLIALTPTTFSITQQTLFNPLVIGTHKSS